MAHKSSDRKERSQKARTKVLEHLRDSGNISYSCKRAGVSRETYYLWRQEEVFALEADAAIAFGKDFVNDLAHTQLIQNIQQGNMGAVKFQLASCHPDYQPRKPWPREPKDLLPPVTEIHIHEIDPAKVRIERAEIRQDAQNALNDQTPITSESQQSHDTKELSDDADSTGTAKSN